jgi:hypothetical protein
VHQRPEHFWEVNLAITVRDVVDIYELQNLDLNKERFIKLRKQIYFPKPQDPDCCN